MNYLFLENYTSIFHGIWVTFYLLAVALVSGLLLSLLFSAIKYYRVCFLYRLVSSFIIFITGTPFLVQLFLIYYGPFQFHWFGQSVFAVPFKSACFCALLALVFNTTAYTTNLFYGALKNIPLIEVYAGESLGLSKGVVYLFILLPRMFTRSFLVYKSEVLMLLKCTALVSTVTVLDLMGVIQQIMNETYQTIPLLIIAGVIYVFISMLLSLCLGLIGKKYLNHKTSSTMC